jgi:hypothetical protein
MKKSLIYSAFGIAFAGYAGLSVYAIMDQEIESLLVCADSGGFKIPFSKNICRAYLFNFRGTKLDIADLEKGVGASFVVRGESPVLEREAVLKYLLGKNLNIDNIGMHQFSALHEAVIVNSTEEVEILLRNGADTNIKDKKYGLTPLELAVKLQGEGTPGVDRKPVITLLESYK